MSSYNIYGGTPKKTLDLVRYLKEDAVIYVYNNTYSEFKERFEHTGAKVYEGVFGRNIVKHIIELKRIIHHERIDIVQTQFSMGEVLGYFVKKLKPEAKLIVAFVGVLQPKWFQKNLLNRIYKKTDQIVYISNYVKQEKEKQFPILKTICNKIIYNGTDKREDSGEKVIKMKAYGFLAVSGLIPLKNISVLIDAFNILINKRHKTEIYLYVAGDGPIKHELEMLITNYDLQEHVFLLGYQKNIGRLINECDVFVHPSYNEGFGIAVAEAMLAAKSIIVADAGALPELIEHKKTGLIVDPHDPQAWADAILKLIEHPTLANDLGLNAQIKAKREFSFSKFVNNYEKLYKSLV
jgi:glycosyltransferase involved in cell wall biosynthesis